MLLKRSVKTGASLWATALMVLFVAVFAFVRPPEKEGTRVLLYGSDETAQEIIRELEKSGSAFSFEEAPDREYLEEAVRSSEAECGFVFDDEFGKKCREGDTEESIIFVTSPFTVKGNVASETVFASLLKRYSELMLKRESERIFEEPEEAYALVAEKNALYSDSDYIFKLEYTGAEESDSTDREKTSEQENRRLPVHALTALFLFMLCLFDQEENKFSFGKGRLFGGGFFLLKNLAALTIPAAAALILNRLLEPEVPWGAEFALLALLLLLCPLWARLPGLLFRRQEGFLCLTILLLLFSFVLTPVFWNPAGYLPALSKLGCILPNGLYVYLLGLTL
ncbi:MAG: hypothetical protein K5985_05500 [Lachnospiraceae bacterium]|nr:hypothetical protein [Lachnospiraceae bacterium]